MRQWVLTFPMKIRWILARKPALIGRALRIFLRSLSTQQRQRAREEGVDVSVKGGAVTFVQRFNSALGLNIHAHVLVPDGVFSVDGHKANFHRLPRPRDEDVAELLRKTVVRTLRMLERELGSDDIEEKSALAQLEAAALKPVARSGGQKETKMNDVNYLCSRAHSDVSRLARRAAPMHATASASSLIFRIYHFRGAQIHSCAARLSCRRR